MSYIIKDIEKFKEDIMTCSLKKNQVEAMDCVETAISDNKGQLTKSGKEKTKKKSSPWNIAVKHCSAVEFKDTPIKDRMKKCSEWWKPLSQSEKDKIIAKYS